VEIPRTGPPRAPVGRPKPRTALRFSDAVTRIRTIPVHAIVKQVYPRPVREGDELAMAIGRAIDGTLSRIGHEARLGRRLSGATARLYATELLDTALEESAIDLSPRSGSVRCCRSTGSSSRSAGARSSASTGPARA